MAHDRPTRSSVWALSFAVAAILLCTAAIINGGPIYYNDTGAYLIDADKFTRLRAPFAVRPIFYGLAIWPFHLGEIFWPALFVQGLIVAHVIYLAQRVCGAGLRPPGYLALIVALVVLTPISWHVSRLLPDIFVAVLILALFLLGFGNAMLRRLEAGYLVVLATASAMFHLTALPVGAALFGLAVVAALFAGRRRVAWLLVLVPTALAFVLSLSFSFAVFQQLTLTPKNPPHLLARLLADGPGREFLRTTCPQSAFMLCEYQDRLTDVEDDFLWRLLPTIPTADGYRIKAEANAVIRGTLKKYPVEVAEHMLANTARQLLTFGMETQLSPEEWADFQRDGSPLARATATSRQAIGFWDSPLLEHINEVQAGIALVAGLVTVAFALIAAGQRQLRAAALAASVGVGLLANALACGALGGVYARYEGRVIWLLPLTAMILLSALRRARTHPDRWVQDRA